MKIAIIGNGGSAIEGKNGEFIDSCDKVIRMKQYVTAGYEECIGTKVDIYVSKWFSWFDNFKPYSPKDMSHVMNVDEYWFMFCDPYVDHECEDIYTQKYIEYSLKNDNPQKNCSTDEHESCIKLFNIDLARVKYYPATYISELSRKLKLPHEVIEDKKGINVMVEPSVGMRVLYKAIHDYPDSEIYITGFDCYLESSRYWDPNFPPITVSHRYLQEKIYLNILIKSEKVIIL